MKVEQLKEKALLEAKIAAQKAQLDAQLTIKEAEQEADRKEKEALLLKEEIDADDIEERLKDFEDNTSVAEKSDKSRAKPTLQIKKEDSPKKDTKLTTQKVKEWLINVDPKEGSDELKEMVVDLTTPRLTRSALVSSLPKLNLPVFHGDPCDWPNWYGMFKALVHDQRLSKTQKMVYLKASVKGTAEKAIAGMFFDGTMYDEAIKELTNRFGNPALISKALINKLLEMPALKDENTSGLRSFVDNLHSILRTLKTYGHGADLKAAANMEQVMRKLPTAVSERWSRKKLELQPKEVDLTDLDKWLETEVQVKEMAVGCPNTKDAKQADGESKPNSSRSKWLKKRKDPPNNTFTTSEAKIECLICKGEHVVTLCETWKKAAVNDRWELAKKFGLCFRCLKRSHRIGRCSLKGTCPVEGCEKRHHPQLHVATETRNLNPSAETFQPPQATAEETLPTGTLATYATCGMIKEPVSVPPPGKVALQMVPVILEGANGVRIRANAFLDGGSGSSYLKEEMADILGLEAERKSLRVSVFGANSVVTDSKTVTVHLESIDGGTAKEVFLWTTPNICEMKAVDWSHNIRSLSHLSDLEIPKPVSHGEVDLLIGSDYYEELLLPLEHRIGKPGEPVGVKTPLGWTIVGHVPGKADRCQAANHTYTFHANLTPEMRADELMRKMWDDEVVGITDQNKLLTAEETLAARKVAESRCYVNERYEVAIPWIDDEPPLYCNSKSAEGRL